MIIQKIKQQRKHLGLTQAELASKAGVSLATLQNIEAEKANPSLFTVQQLMNVLGLKIEVVTEQINWELLSRLGVPLLAQDNSTYVYDENELIEELNRAPISTLKNDRETLALASFLVALRDHYPSTWNKLNCRLRKWTASAPISIKLRRLSLTKLAEML